MVRRFGDPGWDRKLSLNPRSFQEFYSRTLCPMYIGLLVVMGVGETPTRLRINLLFINRQGFNHI